jgi:hypothetical protein
MSLDELRQTIRDEIEALRNAGARRQELSLHACKRLFFDLGIRPSAANVRDLTQTGSASDIPKDIDHFWERIRAASKVRIDGAHLPKTLEEQAGGLLSAMYEAARQAAREDIDAALVTEREALAQARREQQDAQARQEALEAALVRSEARNETLQTQLGDLQSQRAVAAAQDLGYQTSLQGLVERLQAENTLLGQRLDTTQAQEQALRERFDALQGEFQARTEHYAQQIKDAVAEAERRVKPMLVELDTLRGMAATYQSGVRDANRKEFDFLQQLSAAKTRADRLENQLREQDDELTAATARIEHLRAGAQIPPALVAWLDREAGAGRLEAGAFAAIGIAFDGLVAMPAACPKCEHGEPELSTTDAGYELLCPECEHAAGPCVSRFETKARFMCS